jgi:dolichyl-phosphate-mannose--protein O-mannosyl transferase
MSVVINRSIGACLFFLAALVCAMVVVKEHTSKLSTRDLRSFLLTAALLAVGGFGMMMSARWVKLLTSVIIACSGLWVIVRDTFIARMPDPIVSIMFGVLLCLPAIFALRPRAVKGTA